MIGALHTWRQRVITPGAAYGLCYSGPLTGMMGFLTCGFIHIYSELFTIINLTREEFSLIGLVL
jgi:hypothetical protein